MSAAPTLSIETTADAALARVAPEVEPWPERARLLVVDTDASFVEAGELLTAIKALRKEVDDAFDPIVAAAHKAHKIACEQKKRAEAPLLEAERILKGSLAAYHAEQQRKAREEQLRLEAEARARDEERRIAEAAALEAQGRPEEAERVLDEEPVLVDAPVVAPPTPKVEGVSIREKWTAEVVDKAALIAAVAQNPTLQPLLVPDMQALSRMAGALKGELRIPGVRVRREQVVAARGR